MADIGRDAHSNDVRNGKPARLNDLAIHPVEIFLRHRDEFIAHGPCAKIHTGETSAVRAQHAGRFHWGDLYRVNGV